MLESESVHIIVINVCKWDKNPACWLENSLVNTIIIVFHPISLIFPSDFEIPKSLVDTIAFFKFAMTLLQSKSKVKTYLRNSILLLN